MHHTFNNVVQVHIHRKCTSYMYVKYFSFHVYIIVRYAIIILNERPEAHTVYRRKVVLAKSGQASQSRSFHGKF